MRFGIGAGHRVVGNHAGRVWQPMKLSPAEIETALHALEAEGFVLRGKFNPEATTLEWCDRRLLGPDSPTHDQSFARRDSTSLRRGILSAFLADVLGCARMGNIVPKGLEGLESVIELLDGLLSFRRGMGTRRARAAR